MKLFEAEFSNVTISPIGGVRSDKVELHKIFGVTHRSGLVSTSSFIYEVFNGLRQDFTMIDLFKFKKAQSF